MADLIHDDRSAHLSLPLPHPSNDLEDDAPRLRQALLLVDAKFAALDTLLASDDVDLDQLQELVNAIKANASDVVALLAAKAGRDELAAVIADKASRAELAALDADKASKPELALVAAKAFPPPAIPLSTDTVLQPGQHYALDSRNGAFAVTLPKLSAPSWVWLRDVSGACATNPVTVLRADGQTIRGLADDLLIDSARDSVFMLHDSNNWTD
ncbi:MAG: hypothetical protein DI603_15080 [Roseateles depolymerans]|uniref:Uncharacterized protein n=1 Tax=Roseateles depolymerans TaxID=76731 RepID=A0A2W5DEZ2_9BURK|nr:MAG: hypothetical protein DI603_15080 [Roseateles depolymerans]